MPPKQLQNSGKNDEVLETDAEVDAPGTSTESDQKVVTHAWGVPVQRVIYPRTANTSSNNIFKSRPDDNHNRNDLQGRKIDPSVDAEKLDRVEEDHDEYDEDDEDQNEDTSSERDWSGAEYEDKLAKGSKIQTMRTGHASRLRSRGAGWVDAADQLCIYVTVTSLSRRRKRRLYKVMRSDLSVGRMLCRLC